VSLKHADTYLIALVR